MSAVNWLSPGPRLTPRAGNTTEFLHLNIDTCGSWKLTLVRHGNGVGIYRPVILP